MAIKVKHEGNVTSRITAAGAGGRGKRAAEDGRAFAQIAASEAQAENRQLQGAHASPVSPGQAHAQIIGAPSGGGGGGGGGGHAQIIGSPLGHAPGIISAPSG